MNKKGLNAAILSAILFGLSPVACKAIVGEMSSSLLAGLLYLGSGLGLTWMVLRQAAPFYTVLAALPRRQRATLAGAILSGGVAAPLLLAYGIRTGSATEVSLLLNFEAVATTLIAWLVFREHIGYRVWVGKALIVGAAAFVVLAGKGEVRLSVAGLAVLAACVLWGIDNNLTRELESMPASLLACLKGWIAGTFNVVLALVLFRSHVTAFQVSGVLAIGVLSYGASLVLFIYALREIGAARTSTLFASGPFIGTLLAVVVLGEHPTGVFWVAALFMLAGVLLLYGEAHGHFHRHERLAHSHPHVHDEHHQHTHADGASQGMHDHFHVHEPIAHAHVHLPDVHHRHDHRASDGT